MFSKPLFFQTVKSNYKLWVLFTAVLCMYMCVVCAAFTPDMIDQMNGMMESMGPMDQMMGGLGSLIDFIGQGFYGMIAYIFPMVYCIIVGNRMIAAQVDRGSMAYYLTTPTRRSQVTGTCGLYFILSLALMYGVTAGAGILFSSLFQPDELEMKPFLLLTLGCFLLLFAVSGVCFAASCIFNLSRHSLLLGAGIPLASFLFMMISQLSEDLEFFKYLSLNTLFDPVAIIKGDNCVVSFVVLAGLGAALYAVGITVFRKKNLPL